MTKQLDI